MPRKKQSVATIEPVASIAPIEPTALVDTDEKTNEDGPEINTTATSNRTPLAQFVVSAKSFQSSLATVARIVPKQPTHPVLNNVMIVADSTRQCLELRAFDLSLGCSTEIDANIEVGGEFALPGKMLNDIVNKLSHFGEVTAVVELQETYRTKTEPALFETNSHSTIQCTLTTSSRKYNLTGTTAEEFPPFPSVDSGNSISLTNSQLLEGIKRTLFAATQDESKQVLNGVHLIFSPDSLEFQATDGHRLALAYVSLETGLKENVEITVPLKALAEIERSLKASSDGSTTLSVNEGTIFFRIGNNLEAEGAICILSRLLEGTYPKIHKFVPRTFKRLIDMRRDVLLGVLERIAIVATNHNSVAKFCIDASQQTIQISAENDLGSGTEMESASISGESIDIAFNVKYLLDSLKNLDSWEITISLNENCEPAVISPVNKGKAQHLIMPLEVRA